MKLSTDRTRKGPAAVGAMLVVLAALVTALVASSAATARTTAAPSNTSPPTISGNAQEGQTLTADTGTWTGTKPISFSFHWQRCSGATGPCTNVSGATDKIYDVRHKDIGSRMRVVVTATNSDGASSAVSARTSTVTAAPPSAPTTTSLPTISGTPKEGETLTANPNTWSGSKPITLTYRWRRCDNKGGNCVNTTVTSKTYTLGNADVGNTMRVVVTATNSAGSGSAISDPTAVVQPKSGTTTTTPPPPSGSCISVAQVKLPEQLLINQITYNPSVITSRSAPLVARFHVSTTLGHCVSGALVYAVGVPFDRLSKAPEVTSGPDGWATVSFRILPTFQLRHGNLVVIFVRGRKPGDSLLAGVSTRRLVSVRVG